MNAIAEPKAIIAQAIQRFRNHDLFDNAIHLFETLGYNTSRQSRLSENTYDGFRSDFIERGERFNEDKALVSEWQRVELLFQLSNEEMQCNHPNFGKLTVDRRVPASYLFFAIELNGKHHPRTRLANVTREINKLFPMHVFVLFKQKNQLTLSLIDRRENKIDGSKDVMERVTHVHGISVERPHPGHVQILHSFSLDGIREEAPRGRLETFADLHYGWRKVLSTSVLNKRFYLDYQALSRKLVQLVFPKHFAIKTEAHQGVLNLLNRIMFVYFLQKKKWLIGDENFMIHFWNAYKDKSFGQDRFHRDWLNTLFFAAFNGKAADHPNLSKALPEPYRSALQSFPFLNGGLFYEDEDLPFRSFDLYVNLANFCRFPLAI